MWRMLLLVFLVLNTASAQDLSAMVEAEQPYRESTAKKTWRIVLGVLAVGAGAGSAYYAYQSHWARNDQRRLQQEYDAGHAGTDFEALKADFERTGDQVEDAQRRAYVLGGVSGLSLLGVSVTLLRF